jgi:ParB/RepB/Spo0J family partition protein
MPNLLQLRTEQVAPDADDQSRKAFDNASLQSLAGSLKRSGVREPIIVRPDGEAGRYRIVAGERRWRAAKLAGLAEIPCLVDERLAEPRARLLAQAEENLQREDLNVVEEAAVLVRLMEALSLDAGKAGELIGRSYQQARRLLQVHQAPQVVKDAVVAGLVDARAALELVRIYNKLAQEPGPHGKERAATQLAEIIRQVIEEGWSIRQLEAYARDTVGGTQAAARRAPTASAKSSSARPMAGPTKPDAAMAQLTSSGPAHASANDVPWRKERAGVWLDTGRIMVGAFTNRERSELISFLEELLLAARRGPAHPERDFSPRGERPGAR